MDILELKKLKKTLKITNEEISARSGIPKRTIEDIFRGKTKNPRIDTMQAIERALGLDEQQKSPPSELTEGEKEILSIIGQLTDEEIKEARTILNYILNKRE